VYAREGGGYVYARQFSLRLLGCPVDVLDDEPAELRAGDLMLVPGAGALSTPQHAGRYQALADLGVEVQHVG
jgi:hypothetical protein